MEKGSQVDRPLVIVISGPSGVGKDATIARIKETGIKFHYVVTATTRARRPRETDGIDYYFLTHENFIEKVNKEEFLEYAEVYGNYYGVLKKEVSQALQKGEDVILKVDVQGAATLKKKMPEAVFIFLLPPSVEDLSERLRNRNADTQTAVRLRIDKAEQELKCLAVFDYGVVNHTDALEKTTNAVKAIVTAEKCRIKPRIVEI